MEENNKRPKKELAEGTVYLSLNLKALPLNKGSDKGINLAFFPNDNKNKETQPDFIGEYGSIWKKKKGAKKIINNINSDRW